MRWAGVICEGVQEAYARGHHQVHTVSRTHHLVVRSPLIILLTRSCRNRSVVDSHAAQTVDKEHLLVKIGKRMGRRRQVTDKMLSGDVAGCSIWVGSTVATMVAFMMVGCEARSPRQDCKIVISNEGRRRIVEMPDEEETSDQ